MSITSIGVDVNAVSNHGETAAYFAVRNGDLAALKLLYQHQVNMDFIKNGNNALYIAFREKHISTMDFLLQNNFNPNLPNAKGYTPLMKASALGNLEVVNLLLNNRNIDINFHSGKIDEMSALHLAVKNQHPEVVKRLCEAGADLYLKNADNKSPKEMAIENDMTDIIKIFQQIEQDKFREALASYIKSNRSKSPSFFADKAATNRSQIKINTARKIYTGISCNLIR